MDYYEEEIEVVPTVSEFKEKLLKFISKVDEGEISYESIEGDFENFNDLIEKVGIKYPSIKPRELKRVIALLDDHLLYIDAHKNKKITLGEKVFEKKSEILIEFKKIVEGLAS